MSNRLIRYFDRIQSESLQELDSASIVGLQILVILGLVLLLPANTEHVVLRALAIAYVFIGPYRKDPAIDLLRTSLFGYIAVFICGQLVQSFSFTRLVASALVLALISRLLKLFRAQEKTYNHSDVQYRWLGPVHGLDILGFPFLFIGVAWILLAVEMSLPWSWFFGLGWQHDDQASQSIATFRLLTVTVPFAIAGWITGSAIKRFANIPTYGIVVVVVELAAILLSLDYKAPSHAASILQMMISAAFGVLSFHTSTDLEGGAMFKSPKAKILYFWVILLLLGIYFEYGMYSRQNPQVNAQIVIPPTGPIASTQVTGEVLPATAPVDLPKLVSLEERFASCVTDDVPAVLRALPVGEIQLPGSVGIKLRMENGHFPCLVSGKMIVRGLGGQTQSAESGYAIPATDGSATTLKFAFPGALTQPNSVTLNLSQHRSTSQGLVTDVVQMSWIKSKNARPIDIGLSFHDLIIVVSYTSPMLAPIVSATVNVNLVDAQKMERLGQSDASNVRGLLNFSDADLNQNLEFKFPIPQALAGKLPHDSVWLVELKYQDLFGVWGRENLTIKTKDFDKMANQSIITDPPQIIVPPNLVKPINVKYYVDYLLSGRVEVGTLYNPIKVRSSDTSVVSVDEIGRIFAVGVGNTIVNVDYKGISLPVTVVVE